MGFCLFGRTLFLCPAQTADRHISGAAAAELSGLSGFGPSGSAAGLLWKRKRLCSPQFAVSCGASITCMVSYMVSWPAVYLLHYISATSLIMNDILHWKGPRAHKFCVLSMKNAAVPRLRFSSTAFSADISYRPAERRPQKWDDHNDP